MIVCVCHRYSRYTHACLAQQDEKISPRKLLITFTNLSLPNITLLGNIERRPKLGFGYGTEGQPPLNCKLSSNPHSLSLSLSLSPYLDMAGFLPGLTEMLRRIRRGGGFARIGNHSEVPHGNVNG
jgi:hypothetical protein